jgi:hypothetical protein
LVVSGRSYEEACRLAASAQGLDPLTAALSAAGVEHEVEQTGGFCMVVTVPAHGFVLAMIHDSEEPDSEAGEWLLGVYTAKGWRDGSEALVTAVHVTLDALLGVVASWTGEPAGV